MRKIGLFWIAVGFVYLAVALTVQASEPQWLRYRIAGENRRILGNIGSQEIKLSNVKPVDIELPQFNAKDPLFGKWLTPMVESGWLWLALDRTESDGLFDLLVIDSNGDGNLKDETIVTASKTEPHRSIFGPVKVLFEVEGEKAAYHLSFEFISYYEVENTISATSACCYEGTITTGRQEYSCMLIDQNANGTFNDESEDFFECDRIIIDGKDNLETSFLGDELIIGAVIYEPVIARDGSYIKLTAAEGVVYGSIRLPETINRLEVSRDSKLFTIRPDKGMEKIPVGKYRTHLWMIERKDDNGNTWLLMAKDFGIKADFEVNEIGETNLQIGEPIICSLQIRKRGSTYSFFQTLTGTLGGEIELECNGNQPQPPKLLIKNAAGSYERFYNFGYG